MKDNHNSVNIDSRYGNVLPKRLEKINQALDTIENEKEQEIIAKCESVLQKEIPKLHDADLADLLQTLQPNLRQLVTNYIEEAIIATIIDDMSDEAASALLESLAKDKLVKILKICSDLEAVERVLRRLPHKRRSEMLEASGYAENARLLRSLAFATDTVGELMEYTHVAMKPNQTISETIDMIKAQKDLPPHVDKLFIVEAKKLVGVLPLKFLLVSSQDANVKDVMIKERLHTLTPTMSIDDAIDLFERYDLISAPVLTEEGDVMGRVTVDHILFRLQHKQHSELISSSGLSQEEDLFAPIVKKFKNRGFWITINLFAAVLVSRVIGNFEGTIIQIVSLASLMPIIASMAGNVGMQTSTLVIRALTLNQININNWTSLLWRELGLGIMNGVFWGVLVGIFSLVFYQDLALATVLAVSMTVVFVLAVGSGFSIPIIVQQLKGDPALGTAVIVTTLTDCIGFVTFLGLATKFLL